MPRFLQALSKQQHQKSIVILHENTKIERNTKMSDNDPRKGECGVCTVETLGMGKTCKAPRKTNKNIGRSVMTMKLEDIQEKEVKRGSGNTKGLIQALRQSFQAYMHLLIQSRYKKKHADAKIAMRKKKSLKAGKRHRHT